MWGINSEKNQGTGVTAGSKLPMRMSDAKACFDLEGSAVGLDADLVLFLLLPLLLLFSRYRSYNVGEQLKN